MLRVFKLRSIGNGLFIFSCTSEKRSLAWGKSQIDICIVNMHRKSVYIHAILPYEYSIRLYPFPLILMISIVASSRKYFLILVI